MKDKKIIAIIPARGGSKRIPRKNIKLLAGKPLVFYTIKAALKSKYLDRIIVSTEDKEIEGITKKYGSEVIKRPKALAKDKSPTIDVVFHILGVLEKEDYKPEAVVLLQPTSPLRATEDIDEAVRIFLNQDCKSVVSVCQYAHSPYWFFKIEKKRLKPLLGRKYFQLQSQDLPPVYLPNGAVFVASPETLLKYRGFDNNDKILPYIMPSQRSIDIDEELDFKLAELIIQNRT